MVGELLPVGPEPFECFNNVNVLSPWKVNPFLSKSFVVRRWSGHRIAKKKVFAKVFLLALIFIKLVWAIFCAVGWYLNAIPLIGFHTILC